MRKRKAVKDNVKSMAPSFSWLFTPVDSNECLHLVNDSKEQPYMYNQVVPRTDYAYMEDRVIRRTFRIWLSEKHSVSLRSRRRTAIMTEIFRGFSQSVFKNPG